jgi:hypothetical protein
MEQLKNLQRQRELEEIKDQRKRIKNRGLPVREQRRTAAGIWIPQGHLAPDKHLGRKGFPRVKKERDIPKEEAFAEKNVLVENYKASKKKEQDVEQVSPAYHLFPSALPASRKVPSVAW